MTGILFWLCLGVVGLAALIAIGTLITGALSTRAQRAAYVPTEDRSTDALKPVDMADPDDPGTWMTHLTEGGIRRGPTNRLAVTLRERSMYLAGRKGDDA